MALVNGTAGAHLSLAPFFNVAAFSPSVVFAGLSLAVLGFLGFDAISTLAEETKAGTRAVGRATFIALAVAALLGIIQTYLASLFVLERTSFPPGEPTFAAFYDIANIIGGPWLKFLITVPSPFIAGMPGALAVQVATARLLFGMARDGQLPRALAHVNPRHKVPDRAVILVAAITLVLALLLVSQVDLLASMVNFGALTGFLMLHLSVMVQFMWRQKSKDWLRHLLAPLIGFLIIAYVLLNMASLAKLAGIAWLTVGIAGSALSSPAAQLSFQPRRSDDRHRSC